MYSCLSRLIHNKYLSLLQNILCFICSFLSVETYIMSVQTYVMSVQTYVRPDLYYVTNIMFTLSDFILRETYTKQKSHNVSLDGNFSCSCTWMYSYSSRLFLSINIYCCPSRRIHRLQVSFAKEPCKRTIFFKRDLYF